MTPAHSAAIHHRALRFALLPDLLPDLLRNHRSSAAHAEHLQQELFARHEAVGDQGNP